MAERCFIDTTFLVARFNRRDARHKQANEFMIKVTGREVRYQYLTSDYVFDETVTTILYQTGRHKVAQLCGDTVLRSPGINMVQVDKNVFDEAWQLFKRRSDKLWSFTDCTSFTLMSQMNVRYTLSFDSNFKEAGFFMVS